MLYTKTGSGRTEEDEADGFLGWQVGWTERDDAITVFAFWKEAESYEAMRGERREFLEMLTDQTTDR